MEEREVLVPKPRTMVPLWVHFGFKSNNNGKCNVEEAICKVCRRKGASQKC